MPEGCDWSMKGIHARKTAKLPQNACNNDLVKFRQRCFNIIKNRVSVKMLLGKCMRSLNQLIQNSLAANLDNMGHLQHTSSNHNVKNTLFTD